MREVQVSKTELAHLYATEPISALLEKYGICLARLYRILDECDIPRKRNQRAHREIPTIIIKD